jgi:hypothetical protein
VTAASVIAVPIAGKNPAVSSAALNTDRFRSHPRLRDRLADPYLNFLRETLQQYPRLRATRLFQMIRPRGYTGSVSQLRRVVASSPNCARRAAKPFSAFTPSPASRRKPIGPTLAKSPSAVPVAACPPSC